MAISAFVIDDSAVVRKFLADTLSAGGIDVIGTAADPVIARQKLCARWPDVIVLDVEMPRMDGLTFLRQLMAERPTPVVMCSTLTERGCQTTLDALAAGAVDCIAKPRSGLKEFLGDAGNGLVDAVRSAAAARPRAPVGRAAPPVDAARPPSPWSSPNTDRVVAIGVSTGGVQALEHLLAGLDRSTPGIVLVQHMPERFTASLAERLDARFALDVREARDGERVVDGRVLIAPGGRHLLLRRSGAQYLVEIKDGPLINYHRPSVDVMMRSVADCAGPNGIGLVMTGMGDDGARGLREMRDAGAHTAAQDEASCVVFGMPAEAIRRGGAQDVVGLADLADWIRHAASRPARVAS